MVLLSNDKCGEMGVRKQAEMSACFTILIFLLKDLSQTSTVAVSHLRIRLEFTTVAHLVPNE